MTARGRLSEIDISSILQMLCIGRRCSVLRLMRQGQEGSILIEQGQIVHAACGDLVGEEAFFHLVMWRDGGFQIHDPEDAPIRTIDEDWDLLLLEAAQRIVARRFENGLLSASRRRNNAA